MSGSREALAGHLVHGFSGSEVLCQCREGGWLTRQAYMDHLLALIPAPHPQGGTETLNAGIARLLGERCICSAHGDPDVLMHTAQCLGRSYPAPHPQGGTLPEAPPECLVCPVSSRFRAETDGLRAGIEALCDEADAPGHSNPAMWGYLHTSAVRALLAAAPAPTEAGDQ